jgi:hypothetical protein
MRKVQIPTILSLLTPEYQTRMVQEAYHHGQHERGAVAVAVLLARGLHAALALQARDQGALHHGDAVARADPGRRRRNFITNIHVGREFNMEGDVPRLGADVPRWYGETIGFWDGDALITWTSNIQGWKVHASFEFSNKLQTIEIYTPNRDENGNFVGLNHEAIFYDPEALVEPIRIVRNYVKLSGFEEGDPYVFIECVQTIFPINGVATPVAPGTVIEYEVPDMYGRPWAQIWEQYSRAGHGEAGRRGHVRFARSQRPLRSAVAALPGWRPSDRTPCAHFTIRTRNSWRIRHQSRHLRPAQRFDSGSRRSRATGPDPVDQRAEEIEAIRAGPPPQCAMPGTG